MVFFWENLKNMRNQKTAIICAKAFKQPSRIISGISNHSLNFKRLNQSFALAHQTYEGNESQSEGSPILVIHGMLGLKKNWHTFCKSYSEQTGKQVRMVNFAGALVLTQLLKHSPPLNP